MAQGSKMLFAFVCSSPMSPLKTKVLGGISVCFLLSQDAAVLHGTPPYFVQACGCQNPKKNIFFLKSHIIPSNSEYKSV